MKKSLVASLIAVPLLSLSSMVFAAEPATQEPMQLTANQMDNVTAGRHRSFSLSPGFLRSYPAFEFAKSAEVTQVNISPVTIVQIGNNNTAIVYSGNFSMIRQ